MFYELFSTFVAGIIGLYLPFSTPSLDRVRDDGVVNVAVRLHPGSYHVSGTTVGGFDFELAKLFSDHLGANLNLVIAKNAAEARRMTREQRTDFTAAGLHVLKDNEFDLRHGPAMGASRSAVIYRQGARRPRSPADLEGKNLVVPTQTIHAAVLRELKPKHPKLSWTEETSLSGLQLLRGLYEGSIDLTVADNHEFADLRRVFPELRPGFDISRENRLAWMFPRDADDSLYFETLVFLNAIRRSGRLNQLQSFYFERPRRFDYVDARQFLSHVEVRLPTYRETFLEAARKHDLDWRLVAAVGYQESHWDPQAVSPTGVRGLMMLTQVTARHLGVDDRLDPEQSIRGGARYLRNLLDKLPSRITAPDRIWLALAAYNIGFGHLEDARILTQVNGGNPDRWSDVKKNLPLKEKREWHIQTRRGFARGSEAVYYVENVRRYYQTLISLDVMRKV